MKLGELWENDIISRLASTSGFKTITDLSR